VFVTSGTFRIFVPFHGTLQLGYGTKMYIKSKPFYYFLLYNSVIVKWKGDDISIQI
jgi:hypothetical protein